MNARARRVAPLLFASGLCALIYQVAWLREFRLVFGASTAASAAVLAIFIGGLGLGGLLLGRRADEHPRPLAFYARLEALIALSAALTPVLLWLVRWAYIAVGGTMLPGLGTAIRLVLAALVLAVPTLLMGGTLPAAARSVANEDDERRRSVALLYGVNTLGAVTGCFVATFFMLETFGTRSTLWLASLINLLVAIFARQLARVLPVSFDAAASSPEAHPASGPQWFALTSAGVVGFAFFLMELVWYRMLGPILGGTVFTFGLILSMALLGIGLGGAAYSLLGRNRPATLVGFAHTCLLEAAAIALPYALGDRLAILALLLRSLGLAGFWGHVLGWSLVTGLVVLPTALIAGYQFPMLVGLLGRGRRDVGRQIGLAYAWNTAGAIVGSLAGGFGLLPLLSAPGAWRAAGYALLALGLGAVVLSVRAGRLWRHSLAPVGLSLVVAVMLHAAGPTAAWRHSGIGAGRAPLPSSVNQLRDWMRAQRLQVLWEADGVESSVALQGLNALAFVVNGKIDGHARGDAATMIMSGLVGGVLHPEPRSALVIGLGTGCTAGWLASIPGMERVDVVELEPAVIEVARACAPVNRNALGNPKVRIRIGDAREVLLTGRDRYDLLVSEPSNPYRAGIASLFTQEYYRAIRSRLRDGGLFLQWMQAYEVDSRTIRTVYATLASEFPVVEAWQVGPSDLLLVAGMRPVRYPVPALRARLQQEPYRTAVEISWHATDLEGFLAHFVSSASLARAVAQSEPAANTDDRNHVEFGFARTVGQAGLFSIAELQDAVRGRGEDRPDVEGGPVDWARVEEQRIAYQMSEGIPRPIPADGSEEQRRRLTAAAQFYLTGDLAGALASWRSQAREPANPNELALVARASAEAADEAAVPVIEKLRAFQPVEADCTLARLRLQQGRIEEAAKALEAAFARARHDPWARPSFLRDALGVAGVLAARDRALAARLFEALREPFAIRLCEDDRSRARAGMAARLDFKSVCLETLEPLEPNVHWELEWLSLRSSCYALTGHRLAREAARDRLEFLSREKARFDAGLPPARRAGEQATSSAP